MSGFLHQRSLHNPFQFSNPFPSSQPSSTNPKKPLSIFSPAILLSLLSLIIVLGVFSPWVGMPQKLFFTSNPEVSKWGRYTLDEALTFVAKNGTVIVCIVSQPYLPFLNNWLISIAMHKRHDMVLVIAEDYPSLYKVNELWPGHAVLIPPVLDLEASHKFGSQVCRSLQILSFYCIELCYVFLVFKI